MILKSFFRKISTKIYFIIIFIAVLLVCLLSLVINYINITKEDSYSKKAFVYFKDYDSNYEILKQDNDFSRVRLVLLGKCDDSLLDDSQLEYSYFDNKVLFIVDDGQYSLKNDDIIVNYPRIIDDNEYLGKKISFIINDSHKYLRINNIIHNGGMNYVIISKSLYNEINGDGGLSTSYIGNIRSEESLTNISNKYNDIQLIISETVEEQEQRLKLDEYIGYLRIVCWAIIFVFIIVIIIINKNISSDLNNLKLLEYKIGFTNFQIKTNFFKRISLLHVLVFFLVFIFVLSIILVSNLVFNSSIGYGNLILVLILLLIMLVCDIVMAVFY